MPIKMPTTDLEGFRIGIVGHGFVGQAVEYAFTHPIVKFRLYDPKYNTDIEELKEMDREDHPHCFFICAPTPSNDDGSVNSSIVETSVIKCLNYTDAMVIVKSTITPDVVDRLYGSMNAEQKDRFAYNPEFLTEKNAKADFVSAKYHVVGGTPSAIMETIDIYEIFSSCESNDYHRMTAYEASFVKYSINSFLSTKVTFFNQLYDLVNLYGCNFNSIVRAVGKDERVGMGHTRVPGFDGKRGYGGACFPKDTSAFNTFSNQEFSVLSEVIRANNEYRKEYEKDSRELEQNVSYA